MRTANEIMALADTYVGSPYREGTPNNEAYLRQTRADLLKAVEELVLDAEYGRSMRLSTIITAMKGETT